MGDSAMSSFFRSRARRRASTASRIVSRETVRLGALSVLCSALLAGCSGHAAGTSSMDTKSSAAAVAEEPDAAPVEPVPQVAQDAGALARGDGTGEYLGVIERTGLNAIVEQGLGRLLGRLQLSPTMEGKRFRGFRVAALDPQWSASGVLTGDVITRLNGQPIERPEQALAAFDSLRVASEVAVEIVRDGKPMWLRYRVE